MQRVHVLATGGTIASRPGVDGRVLASDTVSDLLAAAGAVDGVEVTAEEVVRLGSYRLTLDDALQIARRVRAAAATVDGVVVTHGTDTMEESAYLVDLLHDGPQPVVFTGAQRNAQASDGDGPRNLRDAVRLAASPAAAGLGAVVAMAGRVLPARTVTKVHTVDLAAFDAPGAGRVATIDADAVRVVAHPRRGPAFDLDALPAQLPRVDVVPLHLGVDGTFVRAAREAGARGIVLEAFGAGNVTPGVLAETEQALADDVLVLVSSRCAAGPVSAIYGAGGGADLAAAGAVLAADLRAPKARLLLTLAIGTTDDPDAARAALLPHLTP